MFDAEEIARRSPLPARCGIVSNALIDRLRDAESI